MSDSGEDWDAEISSGVSKTVNWTPHDAKARENTQNSGFPAPERRFGRGRGRATRPTENWRVTNGSNSSTWNSSGDGQDLGNSWARKPRGRVDSGSSDRDEWRASSGGFRSHDLDNRMSGSSRSDGNVLRIEVSSRDVGRIIGEFIEFVRTLEIQTEH